MAAVAKMEWLGVPIDAVTLESLRTSWDSIQDRLIGRIDRDYDVFDGRTFKKDKWGGLAGETTLPGRDWNQVPWLWTTKRLVTWQNFHPLVAPIKELRTSLSQLRLQ